MSAAHVLKYPLRATETTRLDLPISARPLDAQFQDGQLQMWCLVPSDGSPTVTRCFEVAATGFSEVDESEQYIATVQHANGTVWHVFEIPWED